MVKERGKEWEEYDKAVRWMATTFILSVVFIQWLLPHSPSRYPCNHLLLCNKEAFTKKM